MSNELATLLVSLMGIIVAILLAAIPYAHKQGSTLKGILLALEHGNKRFNKIEADVECHDESINNHETRISVNETKISALQQQHPPRR